MVASAAATVVAIEALLRRAVPAPRRAREVEEGVADVERIDADTLVLGSSHARPFEHVAEVIAERGVGAHHMVVVPEEGGTFHAFNWVLQNRLRPLLEERDPQGNLVRSRLSRALLITTYWDMCGIESADVGSNIPARAWTLGHFLSDVRANGLTDFNRNYLQSRWRRLFPWSVLVSDRGHDQIRKRLRMSPEAWARDEERRRAARIELRLKEIEDEHRTCNDPGQKKALNETLDYLLERGLEVTVVLFPLAPETLTATARRTTLARYAEYIHGLAQAKSFRVADMTDSPLFGYDFETDMDHLAPPGVLKFTPWALAGQLAFLEDPTPRQARQRSAEEARP